MEKLETLSSSKSKIKALHFVKRIPKNNRRCCCSRFKKFILYSNTERKRKQGFLL